MARTSSRTAIFCAAVVALLLAAVPARAAEAARVLSGGRRPGNMFDLSLSLAYLHESRSAQVKREVEGPSTGGRIDRVADLVSKRSRDVLALRVDAGVVHDFSLFLTLPLVLNDDRSLAFARGGDCPQTGAAPGCVDETSATILRDGILPGFGMSQYGLDGENARPFASPSRTVFRGPTRGGFEILGLGASFALLNQARDETKPTWLVRFETRFPIGKAMAFDPSQPSANRGAGPGMTELVWSTVFARKFRFLEPYVGAHFALPIASDGSPYRRYVLGQKAFGDPQRRMGSEFGLETLAWEDARVRQRLVIELRGRFEVRFPGLAQDELWEPLSGASTCPANPSTCRRDVDRDFTGDGKIAPHPGVTRSPGYGVFGGDAGLSVQVGKVRFRSLFGLSYEQDRLVTDARSGDQVVDVPGRRFRVEGGKSWSLLLDGGLLF